MSTLLLIIGLALLSPLWLTVVVFILSFLAHLIGRCNQRKVDGLQLQDSDLEWITATERQLDASAPVSGMHRMVQVTRLAAVRVAGHQLRVTRFLGDSTRWECCAQGLSGKCEVYYDGSTIQAFGTVSRTGEVLNAIRLRIGSFISACFNKVCSYIKAVGGAGCSLAKRAVKHP